MRKLRRARRAADRARDRHAADGAEGVRRDVDCLERRVRRERVREHHRRARPDHVRRQLERAQRLRFRERLADDERALAQVVVVEVAVVATLDCARLNESTTLIRLHHLQYLGEALTVLVI